MRDTALWVMTILAAIVLSSAQVLQAKPADVRVVNGKVSDLAGLTSMKSILVTQKPAFPPWHPNIVEIGSDFLIVAGSSTPSDPIGILARFKLSEDRKALVHPQTGDRLTLLRAFDLTSKFSTKGESQVLLAQLSFGGSGQTLYFFLYREPDGDIYADAPRRKAMQGYQAFRIALLRGTHEFDPLTLSFVSFDGLEKKHRPLNISVRNGLSGYVIPPAFHLVDPASSDAGGPSLEARIAAYEKVTVALRAEEARREKAEADQRQKEAARKQAQELAQQKARSVADAFNDYILGDCNNLMALARAQNGNQVAGAMFNTIRPSGGFCTIDNFGMSMKIRIADVVPRDCDFTRSSGNCTAVMQYSCSLSVKIGQQFDPICPLLRIPFPVNVTFTSIGGQLRINSLRAR